jgi:hypothetical protein
MESKNSRLIVNGPGDLRPLSWNENMIRLLQGREVAPSDPAIDLSDAPKRIATRNGMEETWKNASY